MKKWILKLTIFPLLMLAVACSSSHPDNDGAEDEVTSMVADSLPPDIQAAPPNSSPEAEGNPANSILEKVVVTNQAKMRQAVPQPVAHMIPKQADNRLDLAFENHAAFLYPDWDTLTSQSQKDLLKKIAKDWKDNLGDEDLDSLQETIKTKPIHTLNRFLQFEMDSIVTVEEFYKENSNNTDDIEAYTSWNNLGKHNLAALKGLRKIHVPGNQTALEALQDFGMGDKSDLGRLKRDAEKFRRYVVKIAGFYGVQDYFSDANALDPQFKGLAKDFQVLSNQDHETLPEYILDHEFPICGNEPRDSHYAPCENVADSEQSMKETFPQLLQAVSFTYSLGQGDHYWSFFDFDKSNADGNTRGEVGAYETKDLTFVSEGV